MRTRCLTSPFRRLLPCLTLCLLISACAGTPPVPVTLKPLPRAKPVVAMAPCPDKLSQLTLDTSQLPPLVPLPVVQQLLQQVAAGHLADTDLYFKCRDKQLSEATWITGDGNDP